MSSEERNENVKSSTKTVAQSSDVEIKSYYFKLQCNVFLDINKIQLKKKTNFMAPFHGWVSSASRQDFYGWGSSASRCLIALKKQWNVF